MSAGIRTLEDLRSRCYVDPDTACWHWRGATSQGCPMMWLPEPGLVLSLGSALSMLLLGERKPGIRWRATCGERLCCNPEHRVRTTHARLMASFGTRRTPQQMAICRAAATRHPQALVDAIRADEGTLVEVALRHGVSKSYMSRLRRNEVRAPVSPFAALLRLAA